MGLLATAIAIITNLKHILPVILARPSVHADDHRHPLLHGAVRWLVVLQHWRRRALHAGQLQLPLLQPYVPHVHSIQCRLH